MPSIYHFIVLFGALVLFASIIINGFFLSSRGYTDINPDGTVTKYGMILKGWYFFWYKEKAEKKGYKYLGVPMALLAQQINKYLPAHLQLSHATDGMFVVPDETMEYSDMIEHHLHVKMLFSNISEGLSRMWIFKQEPNYVYPEWIRKMMAGCITCHASFWGGLIFLVFHLLAPDYLKEHVLYGFSAAPYAVKVLVTWVAYTLSVAYVSTWLNKKV